MATTADGASHPVQSVDRALRLLELLAGDGRELSVSELSVAAELPPATTHRLLAALLSRDYVRKSSDRRYALGTALLALGDAASKAVATGAHLYLAEVADVSGETANLAMLEDDRVVYVAQVPGRYRMRMFTEVGRRVLPHSTAVGKVLLAWKPESYIRRVTDRFGLPSRTARTHTDVETFLRELGRVRQRGYALDDEEEEEGVRCLAVPVGPGASAALALSISAPASRLPRQDRELIARMTEIGVRFAASLRD